MSQRPTEIDELIAFFELHRGEIFCAGWDIGQGSTSVVIAKMDADGILTVIDEKQINYESPTR